MTADDYEGVYDLWLRIEGFAIRSIDDSKEGVLRFLKRNEEISVVAVNEGRIIGVILAGHDGRRGCLYHVCVDKKFRNQGIGTSMTKKVLEALMREKINHVSLIAFSDNIVGNAFWNKIGWKKRQDLNYYDFILNDNNVIHFNKKDMEA
ncbi:MAG: GNAT family N-acetyltransferase [Lachnospiraceae bacterium]|nr:GNAT family N-acetyltransferase [Lachnospiraceae bacterium]